MDSGASIDAGVYASTSAMDANVALDAGPSDAGPPDGGPCPLSHPAVEWEGTLYCSVFGGFYVKHEIEGMCAVENPLGSGCSCPLGFTAREIPWMFDDYHGTLGLCEGPARGLMLGWGGFYATGTDGCEIPNVLADNPTQCQCMRGSAVSATIAGGDGSTASNTVHVYFCTTTAGTAPYPPFVHAYTQYCGGCIMDPCSCPAGATDIAVRNHWPGCAAGDAHFCLE